MRNVMTTKIMHQKIELVQIYRIFFQDTSCLKSNLNKL